MGGLSNLVRGRTDAGYGGNFLRGIGQGLTFNSSDEMEAFIRALAAGDINRYRQLKQQVNADYDQWAGQNPKARLAAEFTGMLAPGVAGAMLPGGQGATANVLARTARLLAEPATVAAERFAPRGASFAARFAPRVLPVVDEAVTGALQSFGSADTMRDVPSRVVKEAPLNVGLALASRAGTDKLKSTLAARRNRKRVK